MVSVLVKKCRNYFTFEAKDKLDAAECTEHRKSDGHIHMHTRKY